MHNVKTMANTLEIIFKLANIEERINKLLDVMENVSLEAGIPKVKYDYARKKLDKQTEEYKETLFNWLIHFFSCEYKEAKTMWEKMSPHGWKNLKLLMDTHNLPEQKLLNQKFSELRKAWFDRPRPIKENKQ